ncbi:MAG: Cof-type HAD-IIB family hydrolase [Clostridia bacterium]|nr:Cof-type HAD-IIB family hydrolase [Clostridia bacterium]
MKELNYRLIASDFDGTLIDDNQQISQKVRAAISDYVACGGVFCVCTGRMLRSILPQTRDLGLKGLVIACQGTVIADIESGKIIKFGGMKYEDVAHICRTLEELNQPINVYCGDALYTNIPKDNPYLQTYERIVCVEAEYSGNKISEFIAENKLFCQKVAVLVAPNEREALYIKLVKLLGNKFDVTCSASVLIEISPLGDNKGEAVKFLAGHYGIPIEKTIAMGDNLNDLSMIKAAGLGVAVANATDKLKEAADFISISNNDGAAAQIIEKFGFA